MNRMNKSIAALSFFALAGCSITFNFGPQSWYEGSNFAAQTATPSESGASAFDTAKFVARLLKAGKKYSPADVKLSAKEAETIRAVLRKKGCSELDAEVNIKDSSVIRNVLSVLDKDISFPIGYGRFLAAQYEYARKTNAKAAFSCLSEVSGFKNSVAFSYALPNGTQTGLIFKIDGKTLSPNGVIRGKDKVGCNGTACDLLLLQYLVTGSTESVSDLLKKAATDE